MKIFSGSCCMCDVGISTEEMDWEGNALFSGDIVQLWHGNYLGTDIEEWLPSSGLTAVVANQYEVSLNDSGEIIHTPIEGKVRLFTMGISSIGVQGGEWRVVLVKSHKDIVLGERFPSYGINYHD